MIKIECPVNKIDTDNLMDGDLRPQVDFRTVYASLLKGVLRIPAAGLRPEFGPELKLIRAT